MSTTTAPDTWTRAGLQHWFAGRRGEVERWFADPADDLDRRIDKGCELLRYLDAHGIAGHGWPTECGGSGGTATDRAVLYDALVRTGFAMPESAAGIEVLGSAITTFAPALARTQLPPMFSGRTLWCQGFSEPDAGSDLASLRTRAVAVNGGWRINGHKIWTSLAHRADWCAVLARTDRPETRHRGLSLFWLDMHQDGVTVRPLATLTGEPDFAEVFFDGAFVPATHLVGALGQGWEIAMHLLQFERGMWAWQRQAIMFGRLEDAVTAASDAPAHAEAIGSAFAVLYALRSKCLRTVERLARGEQLGPEVSADKILLSQAEHQVNDIVRTLTGGFATSDGRSVAAVRREWFYSRAASVYGGSVEIQKNILATRVLGLPAERGDG